MDKNTLSNYGWVVIAVLVLSVMIALATPFGRFIATGFEATYEGLSNVANGEDGNRIYDAAGMNGTANGGSGGEDSGDAETGGTENVCTHTNKTCTVYIGGHEATCNDCGTYLGILDHTYSMQPITNNSIARIYAEHGKTCIDCGALSGTFAHTDADNDNNCDECFMNLIHEHIAVDGPEGSICDLCGIAMTNDAPVLAALTVGATRFSLDDTYYANLTDKNINFIINGTQTSILLSSQNRIAMATLINKGGLGTGYSGDMEVILFTGDVNTGDLPSGATRFVISVESNKITEIKEDAHTVLLKDYFTFDESVEEW